MAVHDDPNALRAGSKIAGYEILRVIGSGGFGITYEAASPVTGKHVAIKEFFPRGIASREESTRIVFASRDTDIVNWALKRFESSTSDQCKLKHPNIVEVIHYVKDNDTGYMIMEYVEGETLEQWLRKRGTPPSESELRPLIEPIFHALEYLHQRKLIHRDIAPDNIMVRPDGRPLIIDFGAIKLIEQETQLRSKTNRSFAVSKQFYSPPEQVQDNSDKLDRRADVYAMAATIYRALAGRPPASAEERTHKIAFGEGDPLQPLGKLAPQTRAEFAAAIDRALAFNARERVVSIEELRSELGWSDAASTVAVAPAASTAARTFATTPVSAPAPATNLTPRDSSPWRWGIPAIVAGTLALAIFLIGGNSLNLFGTRGPALIVQQPPPVLTRQPQAAAPPAQAPQVAAKPETPTATPPAQPPLAVAPEKVAPNDAARRDFELAQKADTQESYEQFLARYPDGFYAQLARAQVQRIATVQTRELTIKLNMELRRVGCGVISSDAVWNDESREALTAFNRYAAAKLEVNSPNAAALDALRSKSARVCPLVCGAGQRADGDKCVAGCAPGLIQAPNGTCQRPQQPVAREVRPNAPKGKLVCRWGDFAKGEQPHRQVCEVQ
jgi:serine/threonine protein kinase